MKARQCLLGAVSRSRIQRWLRLRCSYMDMRCVGNKFYYFFYLTRSFLLKGRAHYLFFQTVCPKSLYTFYIVSYNIK